MYVLQHSNGLCVIGLASGHQILTQDKSVVSISWNLASEGKVRGVTGCPLISVAA